MLKIIPWCILLTYLITSCSPSTREANLESEIESASFKKEHDSIDDRSNLTSILGGKVSLNIPEGFALLNEKQKTLKYARGNKPSLVFSNLSGTVNIAISHTQNEVQEEEFPKVMKTIIVGIEKSASVNWLRKDIATKDEGKFIELEFETPYSGNTKMFNLMLITDLEGKLLISSFNCPSEQDEWKTKGVEIMNSLRIN